MHHRAWLACAALSCAAHAVTITLWPAHQDRPITSQAGSKVAWQTRAIAGTAQHSPEEGVLRSAQATQAAPLAGSESHNQSADTHVDVESAADVIVETTSVIPDQTNQGSPGASEGEYIPRPLLSSPPAPTSAVLIKTPLISTEPQRLVGVLSLYINEHGTVDHITSTGDELPPAFEQAAKTAFQLITFTPGQLDGHAVKSRIKVEVVFDNTPLSPAPDEAPSH